MRSVDVHNSSFEVMDESIFKTFKQTFPVQNCVINVAGVDLGFQYYDAGPHDSDKPPLLCLPPIQGNASSYFWQMSVLSAKGYRVISITWPPLSDALALVKAIDVFLDEVLELKPKLHVLGCGFGGYLALLFAQHRSQRVVSLFLINSYCEKPSQKASGLLSFLPSFVLQTSLLDTLPLAENTEPHNAKALDFMASCISLFGPMQLTSRMTLLFDSPSHLDPMKLRDRFRKHERITILETLDETCLSVRTKAELAKYFPEAHLAYVKRGGTFPFLSNPDEINLHIEVHLRRNNARPETYKPEEEEQDDQ